VLLNLLVNAITYAPGTERIDVAVRSTDVEAAISIQDMGPGIAPEDQERIFNRYVRIESRPDERDAGLGLGLFISREIIAGHGGTLTLESNGESGSAFTITLPRESENASAPEPSSDSPASPASETV